MASPPIARPPGAMTNANEPSSGPSIVGDVRAAQPDDGPTFDPALERSRALGWQPGRWGGPPVTADELTPLTSPQQDYRPALGIALRYPVTERPHAFGALDGNGLSDRLDETHPRAQAPNLPNTPTTRTLAPQEQSRAIGRSLPGQYMDPSAVTVGRP